MPNITTPPSLWSALPATKLPTPASQISDIHLGHINIRESISFVILKLVAIEAIAAFIVLFFHTFIISTNVMNIATKLFGDFTVFTILLLIYLVLLKTILTIYVVISWLSEYYEITPSKLIHKKGLIFKKKDEFVFSHLMSIDLQQSLWGRILNYGNIHLYDRYINKHVQLYLIHNPKRYYLILKNLIPYTDSAQEVIREHILENEDEDDDEEE